MVKAQKYQLLGLFLLFFVLGYSFPSAQESKQVILPISVLDSKFEACSKDLSLKKSCVETLEFLEQSTETNSNLNSPTARYFAIRDKVEKELSKSTDLISNALNIWLSKLDPHARIVSASVEDNQSKEKFLEVRGLGIKVRMFRDRALVAYTLERSSAEEIGLKSGDEILAVNGNSLQNLHQHKKEDVLKGAKSPYTILAQRKGEIFQASASEKKYKLENISSRLNQFGPVTIGEIKIRSFAKDSACEQISQAVKNLERSGATRLELDLRDNPGGFVHEAQCAAGLFLGSGKLFAHLKHIAIKGMENVPSSAIGNISEEQSVNLFTDQEKITELPLELRINQNTASAAEMFAAALQDELRAKVTGVRSFGKGSMQSAFHPWDNPDLLLFKTTHLIERPSGKSLQYSGVTPDVLTEKAEGSNFPREIDLTQ